MAAGVAKRGINNELKALGPTGISVNRRSGTKTGATGVVSDTHLEERKIKPSQSLSNSKIV